MPYSNHATTPLYNKTVISIATFNILNLADEGVVFYENTPPYTTKEYEAKIAWIAQQLDTLKSDVVVCQEVFSLRALKECVQRSQTMKDATVFAPLTDTPNADGEYLPRLAIISLLPILDLCVHTDLPEQYHLTLPDESKHTQFSRPVLETLIKINDKHTLRLFTVHLKSKRPDWANSVVFNHHLNNNNNNINNPNELINNLSTPNNPIVYTQAHLKSLLKRAIEAAAIRDLLIQRLWHNHNPVAIMGDFNDTLQSSTTQLIAATRWKTKDRNSRDVMLFDAHDLYQQTCLYQQATYNNSVAPIRRDVSYTHLHEGVPEIIDHCLLSEEFSPFSKHRIGNVERVDVYNDHLNQRLRYLSGSKTTLSDHGQVVVTLSFEG